MHSPISTNRAKKIILVGNKGYNLASNFLSIMHLPVKNQLDQTTRFALSAFVALLVWGHITWDYFHGGIPTHYLLHDDSMPGIPNWLGGIVLPFFTYFLLYRINKRWVLSNTKETLSKIGLRFLVGLAFAITISVCFSYDIQIVDYIMGAVFLLAFIFPLYKSEYLLGWVLGSSFTFGAIIPIGFGSMLCLLFFLIYQLVAAIKRLVQPKAIP